MPQAITSQVLANGLRTEFYDTYLAAQKRVADSRLRYVMDLGIKADNRQHEFGYLTAAPHMALWRRGETIPTDAFGSVQFTVPAYTWGRRIPWHKEDRKDERTQSLLDMARRAGESAALLPERFFFDLITGTASTLPAVPNAPDGAAMFAATAGGAARFGVSGGNLLSGSGVAATSAIRTDFYNSLARMKRFQDGKGQPLLDDTITDDEMVVCFNAANLEVFESAFLQQRAGVVYGSNTAAAAVSNLVQDASRKVILWPTQRITDNDWFVFAVKSPKQPTFFMEREAMREFTSLEGDNNSDHTRNSGEEYIQFESRSGGGIALPYGCVKVDN